jgi:hypothetical protein
MTSLGLALRSFYRFTHDQPIKRYSITGPHVYQFILSGVSCSIPGQRREPHRPVKFNIPHTWVFQPPPAVYCRYGRYTKFIDPRNTKTGPYHKYSADTAVIAHTSPNQLIPAHTNPQHPTTSLTQSHTPSKEAAVPPGDHSVFSRIKCLTLLLRPVRCNRHPSNNFLAAYCAASSGIRLPEENAVSIYLVLENALSIGYKPGKLPFSF